MNKPKRKPACYVCQEGKSDYLCRNCRKSLSATEEKETLVIDHDHARWAVRRATRGLRHTLYELALNVQQYKEAMLDALSLLPEQDTEWPDGYDFSALEVAKAKEERLDKQLTTAVSRILGTSTLPKKARTKSRQKQYTGYPVMLRTDEGAWVAIPLDLAVLAHKEGLPLKQFRGPGVGYTTCDSKVLAADAEYLVKQHWLPSLLSLRVFAGCEEFIEDCKGRVAATETTDDKS